MIKKITIRKIISWEPCYTEDQIKEFWKHAGLKRSATPLEIAQCNYEKKTDLLWILLREEIIPTRELHLLACTFAEAALMAERKAGREPHHDSWNAIKVKRLWVDGKATDEELNAAGNAAGSAAWNAAWNAAESAAESKQLKHVIKILEVL